MFTLCNDLRSHLQRSAGLSLLLFGLALAAPASGMPETPDEPGIEMEAGIELKREWIGNLALGGRPKDDLQLSEGELQLGLAYQGDLLQAFGEIKLLAEQSEYRDETADYSDEYLERGETWLLFERFNGSDFSVRIGRQNIIDPLLWWWDDELDAIRLSYARKPWHISLALAEELGPVASHQAFIDPEQEAVRRVLGHADRRVSERIIFSAFILSQRDLSDTSAPNALLENEKEDVGDADLIWAGLRVSGAVDGAGWGRLNYRLDTARVRGDESLLELEEDAPGISRVIGKQQRNVNGWAAEIDTTWHMPLEGTPSLRIIYAVGSGDDNPDDDQDHAFRQTGLHDEDEESRGYGVVLRPELSNLRILTMALGMSLITDTRLIVGYHRFQQVAAAPFQRNVSIDADPTGASRDIGEEFSLQLQFRQWEDLELDLIAGSFRAGNAYGALSDETSSRLFLRLIYEH